MGATLSSRNDFNRVLATQPRKSIDIPRYDPLTNLEQLPTTDSLDIPVPVRFSKKKDESNDLTTNGPDESSAINSHPISNPAPTPSSPSASIEQTHFSPPIDNQTQPIVELNHRLSFQPNLITDNSTMSGKAIVTARAMINPNDHQHSKKFRSSSFRPYHVIVERNGKQFIMEYTERIERRYVQCMDERTSRMRYFEVIDFIPYRIITRYRSKTQPLLQNNSILKTPLPAVQSNQLPALPSNPPRRLETSGSSNSIDRRSSRSRTISNNNYNTQAVVSNKPVPKTTQHKSSAIPSNSPSERSGASSTHYHSTENISHRASSERVSEQPTPPLPSVFREHTPTISSGSGSSARTNSLDDDVGSKNRKSSNDYEETLLPFFAHQKNTETNQETTDASDSEASIDLFARPNHTKDGHHYRKRPNINKYTEPLINNRRFQQSARADYAPIPLAFRQSSQNQYAGQKK